MVGLLGFSIIFAAFIGIIIGTLCLVMSIEDFIIGLSFIVNKNIRLGDLVVIDNIEGVIEKISLKLLTIKDMNGNIHYLKNHLIKKIENKSKNYDFCSIQIRVPKNTNIHKVIKNIKDAVKQVIQETNFANSILDDIEIYSIDKTDNNDTIISGKLKTSFYAKKLVQKEIENRVKNLCQKFTLVQTN